MLHVLDYLGFRDMYMYARMKQTYHIWELHAGRGVHVTSSCTYVRRPGSRQSTT